MKLIEQRIATLEKQAPPAAVYQIILYDPAIGPPSRQPTWPPVVVLMPINRRDVKKPNSA